MKPFTTFAIVLLALIGLLQLLRFALGWAVTVNGTAIPPWVSAIAAAIAAGTAAMLWWESR